MSQPARRMNSAVLATLSLVASGALHGLLFLSLIRSANGAERAWDELAPTRFVGNTFEIETIDAVAPSPPSLAPEAPAAPDPAPASAPSPATPEAPSEPPPPPAPSPVAPVPSPEPPLEPRAPVTPSAAQPTPSASSLPPSEPSREPASVPLPATNAAPGAHAAEVSPAAGARTPPATSVAAPAYGQDALPASTTSVAKAFTRAVPRIASADKVWHGLPLGAAGSAVFDIQVDAQGKVVGRGTVLDKPVPPQHLASIIGRTVLLLRNQTFAPSAEGAAPVSQRFELSAVIRQVAALEDSFAEPEDLRQIGRLVEPTRVRPGKANFTFNSGRQVELTLRMLDP